MADPFKEAEMKALDQDSIDRDVQLILANHRAGKPLPDFAQAHRALTALFKSRGLSDKGARAQASLSLLEAKKQVVAERQESN
jgi:hypothetical protein